MSNLVLWGHHIDEYQEMFDLTDKELGQSLLEYGSGPSAVNVELQARGGHCVSCDAMFSLDKYTLKSKAILVFADKLEQVRLDADKFDFSAYPDLERLVAKRQAGMAAFFDDYQQGKQEQRYLPVHDIMLPFADFSFERAVSSHYLFGDLEQDLAFHLAIIKELARVAQEVRIFPLVNRQGQMSPFVGPVLLDLQQANYGAEIRSVNYHLQPKGNAMLRIWAQQCQID